MSQTLKYFCHNETQAEAFLQKIESSASFSEYFNRLSAEITARQKWNKFAKFLIEVKKVPISTEAMYNIFLKSEEKRYKTQKDVTTISILPFLNEFLPEVFEENYDGKYGIFTDKKVEKRADLERMNEAYKAIYQEEYWLYTFGEKTIFERIGKTGNKEQKRIYYIKERPVRFDRLSEKDNEKSCRIRIKNIDILSNQSEKTNLYDGKCRFHTKIKEDKVLYYLETKLLDSDDKNDRHLRVSLCFGELKLNDEFGEFGIGIFSGLRDGGAYFTGAALLVKTSVMLKHFENNEEAVEPFYTHKLWKDVQPRIHRSLLKNPLPPLKAAIRMLLERRNRAFVKLPKGLENYTLDELKQYFIEERIYERSQWEPKDLHLSRTEVFISIPLFYETAKFENNKKLMNTMIEILSDESGGFKISPKAIQYGMSKGIVNKPTNVQYDKTIFETNFDHISQSKFFILILPDITFPYHNNHDIRLSTAFLELGFAWGQRIRIIIFCSSEMESQLPKAISAYKNHTIKIINGDLENESDLREMINKNEKYLLNFIKKNA